MPTGVAGLAGWPGLAGWAGLVPAGWPGLALLAWLAGLACARTGCPDAPRGLVQPKVCSRLREWLILEFGPSRSPLRSHTRVPKAAPAGSWLDPPKPNWAHLDRAPTRQQQTKTRSRAGEMHAKKARPENGRPKKLHNRGSHAGKTTTFFKTCVPAYAKHSFSIRRSSLGAPEVTTGAPQSNPGRIRAGPLETQLDPTRPDH